MKDKTTLQNTASLHEKAVQAVASGAVAPTPKRRRKTVQKAGYVQPAYQSPLLHQEVWAAAKKILDSGHGYTRWEIPSENTVIVR